MEKLIQQWLDDALNARDHNVSVPALVNKLFGTCHRTGGDAAVVQDECFACRSYRTEGAEKAYRAQSAEFAQRGEDIKQADAALMDVQDAAAVVARQLEAVQAKAQTAQEAYLAADAQARGYNSVAERRAVELAAAKAAFADLQAELVDTKLRLSQEQAKVAFLTNLAKKMVS